MDRRVQPRLTITPTKQPTAVIEEMHSLRARVQTALLRANQIWQSQFIPAPYERKGAHIAQGMPASKPRTMELSSTPIPAKIGTFRNSQCAMRSQAIRDSSPLASLAPSSQRFATRLENSMAKKLVEKTIARDPDLADLMRNGDIAVDKPRA